MNILSKEGEAMEDLGISSKQGLAIISIFGIAACATTVLCDLTDALPGLLIGLTTSGLYFCLLQYQCKKAAVMPKQEAEAYIKKSGLSRFSLVAFSILLVYDDPLNSLIGFLVGAFVPFRIIVFCGGCRLLRKELREMHPYPADTTAIRHPLLHNRHYYWGK